MECLIVSPLSEYNIYWENRQSKVVKEFEEGIRRNFSQNVNILIFYPQKNKHRNSFCSEIFDFSFSHSYSSFPPFFHTGNREKELKKGNWKPEAQRNEKREKHCQFLSATKTSFSIVFPFFPSNPSVPLVLLVWKGKEHKIRDRYVGGDYEGYLEVPTKHHSDKVTNYAVSS